MNTPTLITRAGLLGLALFVLSAAALRAEGGEKAEKAEKPVPAGVLKKYDKDGDGQLSEAEKAAWKADKDAEYKAMLAKYDTDKDGKLSAEEKAAMKADREKEKKEKKEKKTE
jgi:Ca2+-binding EF-hand superfamily protein